MKFVCNNCGFSADIPEQMTACPMCGSSNVSSAAEISNLQISASENEDENARSQKFRASAGPTQRVTLTEGMNIEEQSETPVKKSAGKPMKKNCGNCGRKVAVVVVILLVLAAAAAASFFFFFQ
ncbi:hypothetical protein J5681_09960 [bacterium]|nr:hypothetical protein [bacterium]